MSRYNLRDVSERLTRSRTAESVIAEFLRSLESMRSDWRASLAFYEVSRDALVDVYEIDDGRLMRRNIVVPLDRLPHRMVRKIFQNAAFLNEGDQAALASSTDASACYVADERDASELLPLAVLPEWQSCVCMPLGHQDDLVAILVLASPKKNAFAGRAIAEIVPIKSVATVSLAQHLYRTTRPRPAPAPAPQAEDSSHLEAEVEHLTQTSEKLDAEARDRGHEIDALMRQIEMLDRDSGTYKDELERVKDSLRALEEDSEVATESLTEAFHQLQTAQWTLDDLERTASLMRDVFQLLAGPYEAAHLPAMVVSWFSDRFAIDRCSLLVPEASGETLRIAAHRGVARDVAGGVRVRVGRGVAGWVAAHRKPLFVRMREDAVSIPRSPDGTYNSDSFIVVPLAHNGRLHGVLNLSNRADGQGFTEADLDRAMLAASAFAVTMGGAELERRASAWA